MGGSHKPPLPSAGLTARSAALCFRFPALPARSAGGAVPIVLFRSASRIFVAIVGSAAAAWVPKNPERLPFRRTSRIRARAVLWRGKGAIGCFLFLCGATLAPLAVFLLYYCFRYFGFEPSLPKT